MSRCQSLWGSEWRSLPSHVCFWTHVVMVSLANKEVSWNWQRLKWDKLRQKSSVPILQRKSRNWDREVRWSSFLCTTAPSCLPGDDSEQTQVTVFLMISFCWAWSPPQSSSLESKWAACRTVLKSTYDKQRVKCVPVDAELQNPGSLVEYCLHSRRKPGEVQNDSPALLHSICGTEVPPTKMQGAWCVLFLEWHSQSLEQYWIILPKACSAFAYLLAHAILAFSNHNHMPWKPFQIMKQEKQFYVSPAVLEEAILNQPETYYPWRHDQAQVSEA